MSSDSLQINSMELFPEFLFNVERRVLFDRVNDKSIKIFVEKGGRTKPIIVNKAIKIGEELFELFGLWFGDGSKNIGKDKRIFGFTNTEFFLLKRFLRLSKRCLGLNPLDFRFIVKIPANLNKSQEEIKKEVSKQLRIPEKFITRIEVREGTNLICVSIINTSRLLGIFVNSIGDILRTRVLESESFCKAMLRGIIASEGCIFLKNGKLEEITIGAKRKSERNFIRKLLLMLGIQPNKDACKGGEAVIINGLSNFKRMNELSLILLHPKKLKRFKEGLKGFKTEAYRKGEGRYLILKLLSVGPKSREELSRFLNRKVRCICEIDLI